MSGPSIRVTGASATMGPIMLPLPKAHDATPLAGSPRGDAVDGVPGSAIGCGAVRSLARTFAGVKHLVAARRRS